MDVEANRSAEKLVLLVTQKRRKRADTEHAANSRRLKRHCSNQHLNSGIEGHVPLVHSDERVYQQDTSPSELSLSPENGQQHPGQDNVASGSTCAHADDGSVKVGNVQRSGSVVQKSPAHSDHLPISTRRSPYCERFLGFGLATRSDGQQDQGKFPSPPEVDLEDPSGEDPEGLELRQSKPELESVPGRQGRPLLSPEQEKESPVPAPARPQTRLQEESSLNLGLIPVTPGPNFSTTCDSSILHHQRLADLCCSTAQDPQHDDSVDDDEVPIIKFGNIDFENDSEHHHEPCENTVLDQPTKLLLFAVTRGHSVDDTPEDVNSDDGGTNGELGERSEPVNDLYDTDTESIEGSQNDATNSHTLSQRLDSMTIGDSGSEGYASDAYANRGSPSPSPEQNVCSSPIDTDALYQDSSSEAASLYEDSDYEAYDDDQSDGQTDEEEDEYLSDLCEADEDTHDVNASNALTPPMAPSGRRRLTSEERELVRQTREIGACVRCRFQKIKCFPDPRNPEGKCKTCKRFSKTSPKTIHRVPCLRLRITEIVLYRSGGLNLTRRWKGIEMRDIPGRLSKPRIVRIQVSQDFCKKPMFLDVVQFTPQDGDVTARYWTDNHSGTMAFKKKELATYCLNSIYETAENVRQYTVENALPALLQTIQEELASGHEGRLVVCRTYQLAMIRFMKLTKEMRLGNSMSQEDKKEVEVFGNLFIMWCAIQHTVGSLYIQGDETLGMQPETQDKSYPLYGKISAPRMIVAQFDNLVYNWVLEIYKEKLLRDVDWLFSQDKNRWWFTMYTVVFILLRESSRMTADRYRHARDNFGPKPRYSIPGFVESLHESCNNILTHWHYYNCNKWPKNKEDDAEHFAGLAGDQLDLIRQTRWDECIKQHLSVWKQFKANNGKVNIPDLGRDPEDVRYIGNQDKFDWDHSLYWVAQMFEKNWYPHPTYQREPVPNNPFPTPISTPS
ncbi:unnamed protein product [Fusarium venenatum]|uniref:Zn(2)-C6 fungal-type domain-containing protein n=1 Tax=Fusarium venenatum TaxID=56646 RepID=A0A2L2TWB6_9HYPO|nr:uncharacterized protein FVRRES_02472 [Fusarium venenatum]CEI65960.1 unnamed protein product [Fusarium venenatum]